MKKLILAITFLLTAVNAHALMLDVSWTGNEVIFVNDFPMLGSNWGKELGLGGPVGNQAVGYKAFEFTVEENALIDYLFVSANVVPNNYPNPNEQGYFQPQGMDVKFQLYNGTRFYGPDGDYPAPDSLAFTSSLYNFSSVDSHTSRSYSDFQIPFTSELYTGNTYWLMANALNEYGLGPSGATFNYTTELQLATLHNPEPATFLLLGSGLLGAFVRRRKRS